MTGWNWRPEPVKNGLPDGKTNGKTTGNPSLEPELTMDISDEEETTINVKRVKVRSWETAKKLAAKHGEHMGGILSRAIDQMANTDVLPREIPPNHGSVNPGQNSGNPVADLVALLNATAALAMATNHKIGVVPGLPTMLRTLVQQTQGLLPPLEKRPAIIGKAVKQNGQSRREPTVAHDAEGE